MTIVSGAASVAPSIGYLDVQKNDNFTGIDEPSIHSQDSFIYDTTYMTARVKEGCVLENPLHKHGSVEQSDPLYDDYLAIEDLEGTQVPSTKASTHPKKSKSPEKGDVAAAADAAHQLGSLLSMKALCEKNLAELDSSNDPDEFTAAPAICFGLHRQI
jgi:hypothetical protein